MKIIKENLWNNTPGLCEEIPTLTAYIPDNIKRNGAIVIFPGGGYSGRAPHEGKGYAEFLANNGYVAFVCDYRVSPHRFPLPLLDARRAVRTVRFNAEKYGIDKNKIAVMGSSAGGHLAALTSTYYDAVEFEGIDEIDKEDFIPNAQILCYPVIKLLNKGVGHLGSGQNLLREKHAEMGEELSPDLIVSEKTPKAFIWHTFEDPGVNVINSLDYAKSLKKFKIETEVHIFPNGRHGLGLALGEDKTQNHVTCWKELLCKWLDYYEF